jgi:hypothetical protein
MFLVTRKLERIDQFKMLLTEEATKTVSDIRCDEEDEDLWYTFRVLGRSFSVDFYFSMMHYTPPSVASLIWDELQPLAGMYRMYCILMLNKREGNNVSRLPQLVINELIKYSYEMCDWEMDEIRPKISQETFRKSLKMRDWSLIEKCTRQLPPNDLVEELFSLSQSRRRKFAKSIRNQLVCCESSKESVKCLQQILTLGEPTLHVGIVMGMDPSFLDEDMYQMLRRCNAITRAYTFTLATKSLKLPELILRELFTYIAHSVKEEKPLCYYEKNMTISELKTLIRARNDKLVEWFNFPIGVDGNKLELAKKVQRLYALKMTNIVVY